MRCGWLPSQIPLYSRDLRDRPDCPDPGNAALKPEKPPWISPTRRIDLPASHSERDLELRVRRMHRRDINRVWTFLKLVFRDVNRETVEYQRPRQKKRFMEIYEEEGIEQLVFEVKRGAKFELVGYAEYAYEMVGDDSWMNPAISRNAACGLSSWRKLPSAPTTTNWALALSCSIRSSTPRGFAAARIIVLEVAENNEEALRFYRKRNFHKLDAAIPVAKTGHGRRPSQPAQAPAKNRRKAMRRD